MDISVLGLFIDVVRQGSFARVARDRNLAPSSVSRAIAGLEQELGIRLFQRSTRKLSPTEAGTTYFNQISPLIEELQQATAVVTELSGQPKGILRVTTSVSFGQACLVPVLPSFQATYPELTVDLVLTDTVIDIVADRIDLAIRLGCLEDSTLMAQLLMKTRYRVCASPEYLKRYRKPDNPDDITRHNCLLFPLAGFRSQWDFRDDNGQINTVPIQGQTVISNASALMQCAIAGMGIALLPNWLIAPTVQNGLLIDLFPEYDVTATDFENAIWLVYPSRTYIPLKVQLFIKFIKTSINGSTLSNSLPPKKQVDDKSFSDFW